MREKIEKTRKNIDNISEQYSYLRITEAKTMF